jgi:hypothetical protein
MRSRNRSTKPLRQVLDAPDETPPPPLPLTNIRRERIEKVTIPADEVARILRKAVGASDDATVEGYDGFPPEDIEVTWTHCPP